MADRLVRPRIGSYRGIFFRTIRCLVPFGSSSSNSRSSSAVCKQTTGQEEEEAEREMEKRRRRMKINFVPLLFKLFQIRLSIRAEEERLPVGHTRQQADTKRKGPLPPN